MSTIERIRRAVDYMEERLKEPLPPEDAARVAGFSSWHFQKLFRATTGDCFKEYIRKRRLTCALADLLEGDRPLIQLAFDYQFESQESFTRAFKRMFGTTPGKARSDGTLAVKGLKRARVTQEYLDHLYRGVTMTPTLKDLPAMTFVGLETRFVSILSPDADNHEKIPALWHRYLPLSRSIDGRVSHDDWGLCDTLPQDAPRAHPDELWYMAAAEVEKKAAPPPGMMARTVPAGRYAVFTHRGSLATLAHTMNYIYGSWLPKSGCELRPAPDLERYDERFRPDHEDSEMDIYIPIAS